MPTPDKPLRSVDFTGNGLMLLGDYLARRLTSLRQQNDRHLDPYATARVRGRIAECQFLAALVEPKELPRTATNTVGVEALDDRLEDRFGDRWIQNASPEQLAEAMEE